MRQAHRRLGAAVAVASALLLSASVVAVPAAGAGGESATPGSVAAKTPNFSGIVKLSNCSGSIVRWKSSKPKDKALMLTNGHCTKFYGADEVDVNVPLVRDVSLLNRDGSERAVVSTTTLLYGTMSRTDVSLYELSLTYKQLMSKYDVPALTVSSTMPGGDEKIVIISGFWKKAYRCHLNGFVYRLKESVWTWRHSLRFGDIGCHTIHGTSGSPVMIPKTRLLIGINNTGNDNGEKCTLNNPCEVDRKGHVTVHEGRHYGEQTWWFTTCLKADRQLDLDKHGCRLPKP